MKVFTIFIISALAAAAVSCKSRLEYHVESYDLGPPRNAGMEIKEARKIYEVYHPATPDLGSQLEQLARLKSAAEEYKEYLKQLDLIGQKLFDVSQDKIDERAKSIDAAFEPYQKAVASGIDQIDRLMKHHGSGQPPAGIGASIGSEWALLQDLLAKSEFEQDMAALTTIIKQFREVNNTILNNKCAETEASIRAMTARADAAANVKKSMNAVAELLKNKNPDEAVRLASKQLKDSFEKTSSANIAIQMVTGDLVPRIHEIYQDMSDPFITYLAAHPENWQMLPNTAKAVSEGDAGYVLVFEDVLDGRWRDVSSDITKIVDARLRIARGALNAISAAVGVAATSFGVPLPPSLHPNGQADVDTIDFSRMTGEEEMLELENQKSRSAIAELRNSTRRLLDDLNKIDMTKADAASQVEIVRAQFVRQLKLAVGN
ncbi:MAG: hypothetical protein HY286_01180 [Planctomycetes bacterium]|nr:hypothetical protein [Planctomycetota bacterium]